MVRLVEFEEPAASLVRLVETTDPEEMIKVTVQHLRDGTATDDMLTAAGLAVSCCTELPPGHHGGPVHPVSGLFAARGLANRLSGEQAFVPTVQSVALANTHIHTDYMGPGSMPVLDVSSLAGKSKSDLLSGFEEALTSRQQALAERHLLTLLEVASPGEIMEVLLKIALPRNALDDHYFLYPVFSFRALDQLGWQHAPVLLRPPVRFLSRHPELDPVAEYEYFYEPGIKLYKDPDFFPRQAEEHGVDLDQLDLNPQTDETSAIEQLADRLGSLAHVADVNGLLLNALGEGMSLAGVGHAMSIGAGRLFLRSNTGNPFDVHVHTGINARRYLLGLEGLSVRAKALGLLSWSTGPEVYYLDETLNWPLVGEGGSPGDGLDGQDAFLDAISSSILELPEVDLRELTVSIEKVRLPDAGQIPIKLAYRYIEKGYDPEALFELTATLVCRDDQSEMHAYKLQQASYEEYHNTLEAHRWVHLVSAVKHVSCVTKFQPQEVHERISDALSA